MEEDLRLRHVTTTQGMWSSPGWVHFQVGRYRGSSQVYTSDRQGFRCYRRVSNEW